MSEESHRQLVERLYESSGDTLRGVVHFQGDGVSPLYVREGIDTGRFKRHVERTIARAQRTVRGDDADTTGAGGYHVELFDGVVVFFLREGSSAGTVVALDSILARNLVSIVEECREALAVERSDTKATA